MSSAEMQSIDSGGCGTGMHVCFGFNPIFYMNVKWTNANPPVKEGKILELLETLLISNFNGCLARWKVTFTPMYAVKTPHCFAGTNSSIQLHFLHKNQTNALSLATVNKQNIQKNPNPARETPRPKEPTSYFAVKAELTPKMPIPTNAKTIHNPRLCVRSKLS